MSRSFNELGVETTLAELAARFGHRDDWDWLAETEEHYGESPHTRLVPGGAVVDGALETSDGPWLIVVDGDLDVTGDLSFWTAEYRVSTMLVTGTVRARNVYFTHGARVGIDGDLVAAGLVVGQRGDSGAVLGVGGRLRARAVVLDHVTSISADGGFDAIVVGSTGWREFVPDLEPDSDEARALFIPDVRDADGQLDFRSLQRGLDRGVDVLRPDAEGALRGRLASTRRT